jgi:hypothetical protein
MQTGPGLDEGIALAEQLTESGLGGPATLDVAALPRGSVRGDAEPGVRAMLAEFGIEVPPAEDEAGRYRLLLWTFGHADLSYEMFEGPFYARVTAWDRQDDLDRKLILLMDERDQLSRRSEREVIEGQMRAAVRAAVSAT